MTKLKILDRIWGDRDLVLIDKKGREGKEEKEVLLPWLKAAGAEER